MFIIQGNDTISWNIDSGWTTWNWRSSLSCGDPENCGGAHSIFFSLKYARICITKDLVLIY